MGKCRGLPAQQPGEDAEARAQAQRAAAHEQQVQQDAAMAHELALQEDLVEGPQHEAEQEGDWELPRRKKRGRPAGGSAGAARPQTGGSRGHGGGGPPGLHARSRTVRR